MTQLLVAPLLEESVKDIQPQSGSEGQPWYQSFTKVSPNSAALTAAIVLPQLLLLLLGLAAISSSHPTAAVDAASSRAQVAGVAVIANGYMRDSMHWHQGNPAATSQPNTASQRPKLLVAPSIDRQGLLQLSPPDRVEPGPEELDRRRMRRIHWSLAKADFLEGLDGLAAH